MGPGYVRRAVSEIVPLVGHVAIILGVESFGLVPVGFKSSMRRRIDP
jgi:hypothetical protein